MCLNYFSVSVIKVLLTKATEESKEFILAHGSRLLSLRIRSGRDVVTLRSGSGSREMKAGCLTHFLLYTVQGPSSGNGATLVVSPQPNKPDPIYACLEVHLPGDSKFLPVDA